MRPGWARTCTCGQTPFSYFCGTCQAWAGDMPDDVAHHNGPRPAPPTVEADGPAKTVRPEPEPKEWRGGSIRH